MATKLSPVLFDIDELNNKSGEEISMSIASRRESLFRKINSGDMSISCYGCGEIISKKFNDVKFDLIGGCMINIQHFTSCNLRCTYCCYASQNNLAPPQYPTSKIIDIFRGFGDRNKLIKNSWIQVSGGEPTILKNFDELIICLKELNFGGISVFTNSINYSNELAVQLSKNTVFITTSLDAGTPSTFAKIRRGDIYRAVDTLVKYRRTNTSNMHLKYIITEENRNEEDLFAFVFLMVSLRPNLVHITPEYPYGEMQIPHESVVFGARLWYLLKKYGDINIHLPSDDLKADPKFAKYSTDIRAEFDLLCAHTPLSNEYNILDGIDSIAAKSELYNTKAKLDNTRQRLEESEARLAALSKSRWRKLGQLLRLHKVMPWEKL